MTLFFSICIKNKGLILYNYLILLFFISSHVYAISYGDVRIDLRDDKKMHQFTLGVVDEQSNDLINSRGLELRYLKSLNSELRLGLRYANFNSEISDNGKKVKKDLLDNGIIQNLELKENSLYIESNYRLARGVMKFFNSKQAQVYIDLGAGLGVSNYLKTNNNSEITKTGLFYSLELGALMGKSYQTSLQLTKIQDGINSDIKNNQSYLGLRIGYLW